MRVLYGDRLLGAALRQRPVAWDAEAVAERRVDRRAACPPSAVVDHRRHEPPLSGHRRLALDHRGDGQDVVRRLTPRPGAAEIDRAPADLEGVELLRDQLGSRRVLGELVERREEEALDAPSFQVRPERARARARAAAALVAHAGEPRRDVRLRIAIFRTSETRSAILRTREALREDDPERDRRSPRPAGRRRRAADRVPQPGRARTGDPPPLAYGP